MSVSKRWLSNPANIEAAVARYRSKDMPTKAQIAKELRTTYSTIVRAIRVSMPPAEQKALAALRYSASKLAERNPMFGKRGEEHHNWIGLCDDGYGYLTALDVDGKRRFVHRIVMAQSLGLQELPQEMVVHHIDGDRKNNDLDNLALTTHAGHKMIHFMQEKDSQALQLKKSTLAEAIKSMT